MKALFFRGYDYNLSLLLCCFLSLYQFKEDKYTHIVQIHTVSSQCLILMEVEIILPQLLHRFKIHALKS